MAALGTRMAELSASGGHAVLRSGDWNIAHAENDIKAWKANVKVRVPARRAQWLTELMDSGWVDVARRVHGDVPGPYSWWSWRGKAFDNDAGWRIDTTWPRRNWPDGPVRLRWRSRPSTRCGGPTTRRSPSSSTTRRRSSRRPVR